MPTSGLPVYDAVVDYGANPSNADNTSNFQNAINAAQAAGGGIVFVSQPGTYSFSGVLSVPARVALMGLPGLGNEGTPYSPPVALAISNTSQPFITASPPCWIENLTFVYPNQVTSGTPIAYPPTIAETQNDAGGLCVRSVFMPNTYVGIYLGYTNGNVTSGRDLIENVYMGVLYQGVVVDHTEDVSRIVNLQAGLLTMQLR